MSETQRTTARGKSGVACHNCGTAYDTCTRAVLEKYTACCSRCRDFDMHDERREFTPGDQVRKAKGTETGEVLRVDAKAIRVCWDSGFTEWMRPDHLVIVREETETPTEPEPTHWSIGDVPPQPPAGTVVTDKDAAPWIRIGETWQHAGMISLVGGLTWSRLLVENGPLTRLVPAGQAPDAEREETVDRLIRVNDALRNELIRYRGTVALRDAARRVVTCYEQDSGTNRELDTSVRVLRRLLAEGTDPNSAHEATAAHLREWETP